VKIETREELAAIWLPWYVRVDGPGVVEHLAAETNNARAVTLGEVASDPQHPVMRHLHPDSQTGPWTHADRVAHYVEQFRNDATIGFKAPVWETAEGILLLDGCHRACATYIVDPVDWSIELAPEPVDTRRPDAAPHLRRPAPRSR
jgi:hypothetical protein